MVEQVIVETFKSLAPVLGVMGGTGIVGYCMGYFLKKLAKLIAIGAGAIFAIIGYFSYQGIIDVNWTVLGEKTYAMANQTLQTAVQVAQHVSNQMDGGVMAVGGIGSFAGCFILGLTRG